MGLAEYVMENAVRGACTCGRCSDTPREPSVMQPRGHTVDLIFFKVAARNDASVERLKALVQEEMPELLDGTPHSYIEVGVKIEDQGLALELIGLGHLLGLWNCLALNERWIGLQAPIGSLSEDGGAR